MALQFSEMTIEKFEDRMRLRRRMLQSTGAALGEGSAWPTTQKDIRASVQNCCACDSEADCQAWLARHPVADEPPNFCKNHDAILRQKKVL
ncbi:DUF6455 family protein [Sulfitobacter mediterraneus]|uniref:DUF6455 domain-containing protein n=1 Tax=Sulfitobacter mediterraneus TaxID=83219 RepID=A0A2T6CFF9_9RHOB|nr:DUF6455 family protein [Sulfitobacter mediterraneus]KIN77797.1 hypothetical protein Z950_448 [Sulfitobacter mediterraneus KCTC 32188]PTX74231.1 hypothetical protein C8N31_104112 [Sulfitobacter mediterraneus]UWR12076.1 hypothetical protein K3753_04145 [Sulfitobacter mediterraneus]